MQLTPRSGAFLAATAAALLLDGLVTNVVAAEEGKQIHCVGANACKGTTSCKTATNACKGLNSCKGQGFVSLTAEQCKQIGGKIEG